MWETPRLICLTNARESVFGGFVAGVAGALIASDHVHTLTVPAQLVTQFTLIDICRETHNKHNTELNLSIQDVYKRKVLVKIYKPPSD